MALHCYPNNKPWVAKDIRAILNHKELRDIQRELNAKIKEAKDSYRRKLERKLQQNNTREIWSDMRTITDFRSTSSGADGSVARANELNLFFIRFDTAALAPAGSSHHCFFLIAPHPT